MSLPAVWWEAGEEAVWWEDGIFRVRPYLELGAEVLSNMGGAPSVRSSTNGGASLEMDVATFGGAGVGCGLI